MKKIFAFISILISLLWFSACTKDPLYIETVSPNDNTAIVNIDTFLTSFMIKRVDSFQTSASGVIIAGSHSDPVIGKTTSTPMFRFSLPGVDNPIKDNNNLYYDSLVLIMKHDQSYYGDTTSLFNMSVYRLQDEIVNSNNIFYNTSDFSTFPETLGSITKRIRPRADDSLRIRLTDNIGQEIFNFYKTNSAEITSNDNFQRYFKGIKISTDENVSNVIYGFKATDSSAVMRLYYHADVSVREKRNLDFNMQSGQFQFNHISTNTAGTTLEKLLPGKEISSSQLNNEFFISPLAGIRTFITLPSIKDLLKIDGYVKVLSASLQLRPEKTSYLKYPLFASLNIYTQAPDLSFLGPLVIGDNTQTGNLVVDNIYGENTVYTYDITAYVTNEITSTVYNSEKIMPSPVSPDQSSASVSIQRMVGVDGANNSYRSKLSLQVLLFRK